MFLFRERLAMPDPADTLPGRTNPIPTAARHFVNGHPLNGPDPEGFQRIVLGLGCFWGTKRRLFTRKNPAGYCGVGGTGPIGVSA